MANLRRRCTCVNHQGLKILLIIGQYANLTWPYMDSNKRHALGTPGSVTSCKTLASFLQRLTRPYSFTIKVECISSCSYMLMILLWPTLLLGLSTLSLPSFIKTLLSRIWRKYIISSVFKWPKLLTTLLFCRTEPTCRNASPPPNPMSVSEKFSKAIETSFIFRKNYII